MNPTATDVKLATDAAHQLEREGYFAKAKTGDERAASYFARLTAARANPTGSPRGWGALKKTGGGFNVEGYADGAIVFGNDSSDRSNVLKIVTQIGSSNPNAIQIGDAVQERRDSDVWASPVPVPDSLVAYIAGSATPVPQPPAAFTFPSYADLGDDAFYRLHVGVPLAEDVAHAGETLNDGSSVWFSRAVYRVMAADVKHRLGMGPEPNPAGEVRVVREEWRAVLKQAHPGITFPPF
jgi:hypothetical protein